jgi:hypothetical protein
LAVRANVHLPLSWPGQKILQHPRTVIFPVFSAPGFCTTPWCENQFRRVYAQALGYSLDASGNISYLDLINSKLEGRLSWAVQVGLITSVLCRTPSI